MTARSSEGGTGPRGDRTARAARFRKAQAAHRAGRLEAARDGYSALLEDAPDHAGSLHGLGCIAGQVGRPDLAIGYFGRAIAIRPHGLYYTDLATALLERGHAEEARAAAQIAVLRLPDDPQPLIALSRSLAALERFDEAERALRQAVALAPRDPAAHQALALLLDRRGDRAGAGDAAATIATLLPRDPAAQANLGAALFGDGRLAEARAALERAMALGPATAATRSNLGLVLMAQGELEKAEAMLAAAAALAPEDAGILTNHGTALADLGRLEAAEARFRAVPDFPEARFNLGTLRLAQGHHREGWALFEARKQLIARPTVRGLPEWDGSPASGPVLVEAEQGLGDTLHFLRYVRAASARVPVLLSVPEPLRRLAAENAASWGCRIAMPGDPAPAARCALLSLPHLLAATDHHAQNAYVAPPPDIAMAWRARLTDLPGVRAGLAWAGNPGYRFDARRSLTLSQLAPLAAVKGVSFVSLQVGAAALQPVPEGMALTDLSGALTDLADTAAAILALDLVITVDSAMAHLAGALGVAVWLLDRFGGDWRWQPGFTGGKPLYPGLKRFVQDRAEPPVTAWPPVIWSVAEALRHQGRRQQGQQGQEHG